MPVHMVADTQAALGADRSKCASRSLFMDKFPEFPGNDKDESRRRFLESVTLKSTVVFHRAAFAVPNSTSFTAVLGGRLIVNHAGGVIENAGLCLDRHTGEPYIPGSALKGIAADAARDAGAGPAELALVFGGLAPGDGFALKSLSGSVAFLPAYPVKIAPLELDILTCHHKDYYAGKIEVALDNEQPNPQVFPVVKAGAEFIFTIALLCLTRLDGLKIKLGLPAAFDPLTRAAEWLKSGLQDHGIGAKTAAGYGWFIFDTSTAGAPATGAPAASSAPMPDFNEKIFRDSVIRILDKKGEWQNLQKKIELLKKPINRPWLEKLWSATQDRDYKDLRHQPWYPKQESSL